MNVETVAPIAVWAWLQHTESRGHHSHWAFSRWCLRWGGGQRGGLWGLLSHLVHMLLLMPAFE